MRSKPERKKATPRRPDWYFLMRESVEDWMGVISLKSPICSSHVPAGTTMAQTTLTPATYRLSTAQKLYLVLTPEATKYCRINTIPPEFNLFFPTIIAIINAPSGIPNSNRHKTNTEA